MAKHPHIQTQKHTTQHSVEVFPQTHILDWPLQKTKNKS